jgi:predicted nucleic acid-binding protein
VTVAFDNTFLTLALNPAAPPAPNPASRQPIPHCRERIEALIDSLSRRKEKIIIPTPVLAEALCSSADFVKVLEQLDRHEVLEVQAFDVRAAVELADITRRAKGSGDKKSGVEAGWQLVKFDRQIVAIAKVHGASIFYTDDDKQTKFAELAGLAVRHTWDLDLPDGYAQRDWVKETQDTAPKRTGTEAIQPPEGGPS